MFILSSPRLPVAPQCSDFLPTATHPLKAIENPWLSPSGMTPSNTPGSETRSLQLREIMAVTGCVSYALCGQLQRLSLKTHRRVAFRASRCLTLCTAGARPEHAPKEVVGRAQSRLQTLLAGCGCQALACRGSCVFLTSLCLSFVWDVSVELCLACVGGCPGRAGNLLFVLVFQIYSKDYAVQPSCCLQHLLGKQAGNLVAARVGTGRRSWL